MSSSSPYKLDLSSPLEDRNYDQNIRDMLFDGQNSLQDPDEFQNLGHEEYIARYRQKVSQLLSAFDSNVQFSVRELLELLASHDVRNYSEIYDIMVNEALFSNLFDLFRIQLPSQDEPPDPDSSTLELHMAYLSSKFILKATYLSSNATALVYKLGFPSIFLQNYDMYSNEIRAFGISIIGNTIIDGNAEFILDLNEAGFVDRMFNSSSENRLSSVNYCEKLSNVCINTLCKFLTKANFISPQTMENYMFELFALYSDFTVYSKVAFIHAFWTLVNYGAIGISLVFRLKFQPTLLQNLKCDDDNLFEERLYLISAFFNSSKISNESELQLRTIISGSYSVFSPPFGNRREEGEVDSLDYIFDT